MKNPNSIHSVGSLTLAPINVYDMHIAKNLTLWTWK